MNYDEASHSSYGGSEGSEEDDVPPSVADLKVASVPDSLKALRACMRCGIIKTVEQFVKDGCENCPFLDLQSPDRINSCTTAFFEGTVAVMDPRESWAAKWLRIDAYMPGVYAISVTGQFSKDMEDELEAGGRRWRCKPPS